MTGTDDRPSGSPPAAPLAVVVDRWVARWGLVVEDVIAVSACTRVVGTRRRDGSAAVLKVAVPHRESAFEGAALAHWDGDGAVRLLAADGDGGALLLERCRPGTALADRSPAEALDVLVALLPRLWRPAGPPFVSLEDEAGHWRRDLPGAWRAAGEPFEGRLLDRALEEMERLLASAPEEVLVHQDLHAGNVLGAEREPWLVIDPKPVRAEPAFALAPVIRGPELGGERGDVHHRLDRLSAELGVDRRRAAGWALVQTLAWAFDQGGVIPHHVDTARWLVERL
ncbi:MAG: aminoglycoside phosphotransferase family protein [Acidimicrobiales bacterium]